MKCFMQWWGGYNYGHGEHDEAEEFPSIAAAAREFEHRYTSNGLYKNSEGYYTPGVGLESEARIFFTHPAELRDPYPDRLIRFGPRGGVVVERC